MPRSRSRGIRISAHLREHNAFLAFGANIGDAKHSVLAAWETLRREPIIDLVAISKLYRTEPVGGPPGQEEYVNAVGHVRTVLSARELLDRCLGIERQFGRERTRRWGPRTLDIDLVLYDSAQIVEPGLTVPHPRLRERLFVLVPLSDVASQDLKLPPDGKTLHSVLHAALAAASQSAEEWERRAGG